MAGFGIMGKKAMETMGQAAQTTSMLRPEKEKKGFGGGLMAAAAGAVGLAPLGLGAAATGAGVGLASYYLSK